MKLDPAILALLVGFGYGITLALIKRWFVKLDNRLDEQEKRYWQCRETALKEFANKDNTRSHIAGLFKRVEELAISIARGKNKGG